MIEVKIRDGHGRVCSTPGCKNRKTKAITRGADGVGVIYLCEECIAVLAGRKAVKTKQDVGEDGDGQ